MLFWLYFFTNKMNDATTMTNDIKLNLKLYKKAMLSQGNRAMPL